MISIELPTHVEAVLDRLRFSGLEGYIVGGCVRDSIMGRTPNDWDITTSARPAETLELFSEPPFKAIPTGLKHGTVTVVYEGEAIEVTTFRVDGEYLDGRHPERVSFTSSIAEDLARRDFTINAMAYSPRDGVIDLYGGAEDIASGVIRCVGEARKRFSEDALRILRAVRFASVLGFELEDGTAKAAIELSDSLELISRERVGSELSKLFGGKNAVGVISEYSAIISRVINITGELDSIRRLYGEPLPLILAAALEGSDAEAVLKGLRFDKRTIARVCTMLAHRGTADYISAKELCAEVGVEAARDIQRLWNAKGELSAECIGFIERIISEDECISVKQLRINAEELKALGIEPKDIGTALKRLLRAVIKGEIPNERGLLLKYASEVLMITR